LFFITAMYLIGGFPQVPALWRLLFFITAMYLIDGFPQVPANSPVTYSAPTSKPSRPLSPPMSMDQQIKS
ncbi:MAG: hypothetical protein SGI97_10275, partial [candidate division Zixibacteria bacterium]|nr:hypothetical protein [candidate division Zixibacteria bacterium]